MPNSKAAISYVKPEAEFGGYTKILMLDAYVAFKKNWQRDTRVAGRRISNKEAAELLYETFREELEKEGGYEFVDKADDDVLILRPALIDLVITAPDIPVAGRVTQYVASAGAATLFLELYDSVSGEILARAIDRRNMQDYGSARWAQLLRSNLDEIRSETGLDLVEDKSHRTEPDEKMAPSPAP